MVVRQYPMEFKVDAAKLVEEKGYTVSEAANSLEISQANLTKWRKQYREGRLLPGHRRAKPTAEEVELRRLQSEVKRLEMELVTVKKATIYFTRHSTWGVPSSRRTRVSSRLACFVGCLGYQEVATITPFGGGKCQVNAKKLILHCSGRSKRCLPSASGATAILGFTPNSTSKKCPARWPG